MLLSMQRVSRPAFLLVGTVVLLYVLYVYRTGASLLPQSISASENKAHDQQETQLETTPDDKPKTKLVDHLFEQQVAFWQSIYPTIIQNKPQCERLDPVAGQGIGYDPTNHDEPRPNRLTVSTTQADELRFAHERFTDQISSGNYTLPMNPNTRGIVTTAGGPYLPVALLSLRMLRLTGSQLPLEVFLASQAEWDHQICDVLFPTLNARCIVLEDIFNPSGERSPLGIDKYQYKIMSILFSSFEEVLFLDSDCFPVVDPASYFESTPFQSTGLIRWPDFWFASESPYFFEIANIPEPDLWAHSATESGELFYSKKLHTKSLLLALYYNFYGPGFYYPLQSQGNPGEGDKETFIWSAVVFNESFFSVHKPVQALGYMSTEGKWRGSAMVQFDPVEDYSHQEKVKAGLIPDSDRSKLPFRPLFVHVNFPKIDPGSIFDEVSFGVTGPTKDVDGKLRRIWHENAKGSIDYFGYDLERKLWSVVKDIACEYENTILAWQGKTGVCEKATNYWNTVFEDEEDQEGTYPDE